MARPRDPEISHWSRIAGVASDAAPNLRALASTGLRSLVLIAITLLLILIVLPAALVAAGT